MKKHPGGRPRKYTKKQVNDLMCAFENYIENTDIPIIVEFTAQQGIVRSNLYDYPEFSTLLKRATEKKAAAIEKGMLIGELVPSAAIFSLKQLGFSDKQDVSITGRDGGPIRIVKAEELSDEELASIATSGSK